MINSIINSLFVDHPYSTIILIFMLFNYKKVIEALSSYDKDQSKMIVSSRKVIAFMTANSFFHQVNYCLTHSGMKDFNVYVGWTECTMTLVLLGLVSIPEIFQGITLIKSFGTAPIKTSSSSVEIKKTETASSNE